MVATIWFFVFTAVNFILAAGDFHEITGKKVSGKRKVLFIWYQRMRKKKKPTVKSKFVYFQTARKLNFTCAHFSPSFLVAAGDPKLFAI